MAVAHFAYSTSLLISACTPDKYSLQHTHMISVSEPLNYSAYQYKTCIQPHSDAFHHTRFKANVSVTHPPHFFSPLVQITLAEWTYKRRLEKILSLRHNASPACSFVAPCFFVCFFFPGWSSGSLVFINLFVSLVTHLLMGKGSVWGRTWPFVQELLKVFFSQLDNIPSAGQ